MLMTGGLEGLAQVNSGKGSRVGWEDTQWCRKKTQARPCSSGQPSLPSTPPPPHRLSPIIIKSNTCITLQPSP